MMMYHQLLFGLKMSNIKIFVNGKDLTLTDATYLAQGGEGMVHSMGQTAYKIYHEPKKCISESKIKELAALDMPNVLGPRDVIYDSNSKKPIGYTMPFIRDSEYLCRLFVGNFKTSNNITDGMIVSLVDNMRTTLLEIHKKNVVVGDYNEMNFLVDKKFTTVYHIDVDSYQTKNFKCTAIMDSIRDRALPYGEFNQNSDWFSWAIVTFQLYTGIHPFKGKHPAYKPNDMDGRMKNNISVFDPDVKVPKCLQDFSNIPPAHLAWYKKIFINGERGIPPESGDLSTMTKQSPAIIIDGNGLKVELLHDYIHSILGVYHYNNLRYVVTTHGVFKQETEVTKFSKPQVNMLLGNVLCVSPIIAMKVGDSVAFFDLDKQKLGEISADSYMQYNGSIYTIRNSVLTENYFEQIGSIKHLTKAVATVTENSSKMFPGVICQDIFGAMKLTIPYEHKKCANVAIPELNGYRIIDAKRSGQICVLIGEKMGIFDRVVIYFNDTFTSYEFRKDVDVDYRSVNMMLKQNGMAITIKDLNTLELFYDIKRGYKEIVDSPIDMNMNLCDGAAQTMFANNSQLYVIKS